MSAATMATGPRTPEGKAASSRNSLQHGLTSKQIVLPGEDAASFDALRQSLIENHDPAEGLETILIDQIAQNVWRLNRARRMETEILEQELTAPDGAASNRLEKLTRYMSSIERAFHRAVRELANLQANRNRTTIHERKTAAKEESAAFDRALHAYINAPIPVPQPGITKRTPANPADLALRL